MASQEALSADSGERPASFRSQTNTDEGAFCILAHQHLVARGFKQTRQHLPRIAVVANDHAPHLSAQLAAAHCLLGRVSLPRPAACFPLSFEQRQRDRKNTAFAQAFAVSLYGTAMQGNDVLDQVSPSGDGVRSDCLNLARLKYRGQHGAGINLK